MKLTLHTPADQGRGAFDGGKITEIKPIGFPGDGSRQGRIGPLLYWAWASARGEGVIGMHPHQGFEIMSYVFEGAIGHTDSAGNERRVSAGGMQAMQTGSGIRHQEEMHGARTEFFQVWFEPNLKETLRQAPAYHDFQEADFSRIPDGAAEIRRILDPGAPLQIVADAAFADVAIPAGAAWERPLGAGRALAVVCISGAGEADAPGAAPVQLEARDFLVAATEADAALALRAAPGAPLRLAIVEIPQRVPYPLFTD